MASGKVNKLIFADAKKARDNLTLEQQREISRLYKEWSKDLGERSRTYQKNSDVSQLVYERQIKELQKSLKVQSRQISNEIYKGIKQSIYLAADAVVSDNVEWLKYIGLSGDNIDMAFNSVPDNIVRMLVTGQLYKGGWNLSSRIWGNNEQTMKEAYKIVAGGMAENKPVYEIAKELESYVQPGAAKKWNPYIMMKNTTTGEWERKKLYKRQVDYNAQRLARTLIQHGYQQSFIAVTKNNPFILEYVWNSNGSRPCPLCRSRDGKRYRKDELPLDHPNGQCTMEPVVASNLNDQLADWFNSPNGTYPDIDKFATELGYKL